MSLCDSCKYCMTRVWEADRLPEDLIVIAGGDKDEPYIIKYCVILDYAVSLDNTIECSHYRNDVFGGLKIL